MGRKKTHEEFMRDFEEKQPELFIKTEVLGEYVKADIKIKCKCLIDGHEWDTLPSNLLRGHGCSKCRDRKMKKTHEEFMRDFEEKQPENFKNIEIIGEYVNDDTKIKCKCLIDGHEWDAKPHHLLQGTGCSECRYRKMRKTHEKFVEEMKEINPNIKIIGEYVNADTEIKCKCLIDEHEWDALPSNLLRGHGCSRCVHAGESWMDRTLHEILLEYDPDAIYRGKDTIGMELDSFCPNLNLAFEPGSWRFHEGKVENDEFKRKLCADKGIRCITIYDSFPENIKVPFEEDCYIYPKDFGQNKEEFFEQMNKLIPKIIGGE